MKTKRFSQSYVANRAGMKRQSNISSILSSKHMRTDNLLLLLDAMDCDLIVRSRTEEPSPEGRGKLYKPEWVITADADDETQEENRQKFSMREKYLDDEKLLEMKAKVENGELSIQAACNELGISRPTWYSKIQKLDAKEGEEIADLEPDL